ncbi:uncharacterized protein [Sagmatias obliquidens]|uniref:uncharacterized protein n=1 Tax=Sagmatias obliquidens TaxID=3371155 RepID=UPI000F446057|nr:uncharacterized protein LOC113626618 [Lagenorhynchus obliquidens]
MQCALDAGGPGPSRTCTDQFSLLAEDHGAGQGIVGPRRRQVKQHVASALSVEGRLPVQRLGGAGGVATGLQQPGLLSFWGHGWGLSPPTQTPRRTRPSPSSLRVPSSPSGALQPWTSPNPSSRARHVASPLPSPRLPTVAAPNRARFRCPEADQPPGHTFTSSSWSVIVYNTCLTGAGANGAGVGSPECSGVQDLTQPTQLGSCNSASTGAQHRGTDPQPWSSCHGDRASTRPATGVKGCGKAWQGWRPSCSSQGRGCGYVSPPGVAATLSQAPSPRRPHCGLRGVVAWPPTRPVSLARHTHLTWARAPGSCHAVHRASSRHGEPGMGTGEAGRRPRCWSGRQGPAAPRARPGRAPSAAPRRRAPGWERIGRPEPPTREAEAVPR